MICNLKINLLPILNKKHEMRSKLFKYKVEELIA